MCALGWQVPVRVGMILWTAQTMSHHQSVHCRVEKMVSRFALVVAEDVG